jgi:thymidylate kinase
LNTGIVVAFDGLDGAGKSTQCAELQRVLLSDGMPCEVRSLSSGDAVERMLMQVAADRALDTTANRYALISKLLARQEWLVRPQRHTGVSFIYDKYLLSFLAKEIVRGADSRELRTMIDQLDPPDVTVVLDIAPDLALVRKDGKVGYREAGLNLVTYEGKTVTPAGLESGAYPEQWVQACFLDYQRRVRSAQEQLLGEAHGYWAGKFGRSIVVLPSTQPSHAIATTIRRVVRDKLPGGEPVRA